MAEFLTIKYNSNGIEQWVARYEYDNQNNVYDLVVDDMGNVYVTGFSRIDFEDLDYITIKYNSEGVEQWVSGYNGSANSYDKAYAIVVDITGNTYVTDTSTDSETDSDIATIKYNPNGEELWVARYNGPENSSDSGIIGPSGNIYVTGWSKGTTTDYDFATIKYNSEGVEQWLRRYNGPENLSDTPRAIAVDISGNIYVTGRSGSDYVTIKYDSSGVEQWIASYNCLGNSSDYATAISVNDLGNVFVTGYSVGYNGNWRVCSTIKYCQPSINVTVEQNAISFQYYLSQNYPNPFNPSTTIHYSVEKTGLVKLKIYNLLGKEIQILVNKTLTPGDYNIQWTPNDLTGGVYIYRLEAGEFVETKKLLYLK